MTKIDLITGILGSGKTREIPAAVTAEQTSDSMRREAHGNQFSKIC